MMLDSPVYFELVLKKDFFPKPDMFSVPFDWLPPDINEEIKPKNGWEVLHKFFQNEFGTRELDLPSLWAKAFFIADDQKKLIKAEKFCQFLMKNETLKNLVHGCFKQDQNNFCSLFEKELKKTYQMFKNKNNLIDDNNKKNIKKGYYWEFNLDLNSLLNKTKSESNSFSMYTIVLKEEAIRTSAYEIFHNFFNKTFSTKELKQKTIPNKIIIISDEITKLHEAQNFINYLNNNKIIQNWPKLTENFDRDILMKNLQTTYNAFELNNELNNSNTNLKKIKI